MLKSESLQEIAKRVGVTVEILTQAINDKEEVSINFSSDTVSMTTDEITAIEERGKKIGYKEGVTAGEEMLIKSVKNSEGLDFEGKTKDNLLKALKEKIIGDAKAEPTKRVQELESDLTKLRSLIEEKEKELSTKEKEWSEKLTHNTVESEIKMRLPEKLDNGLTRDDLYTLYKAGRKFQKTEIGIELIDIKTGEAIKDKKLSPVSIAEDLNSFITRFNIMQEPGRDAKDNVPKTGNNIESFKKRSDVDAYFEKNNTPLSEKAAILAKAMKNEGFEMLA